MNTNPKDILNKMNQIFRILLILPILLILGSSKRDGGLSLALDSSNNAYVTGFIEGDFDWHKNLNINCESECRDIFLVKYDADGNKSWSKNLGTNSYDQGSNIFIDSYNNIYLTGETEGNLNSEKNNGRFDIFLMKYKVVEDQ